MTVTVNYTSLFALTAGSSTRTDKRADVVNRWAEKHQQGAGCSTAGNYHLSNWDLGWKESRHRGRSQCSEAEYHNPQHPSVGGWNSVREEQMWHSAHITSPGWGHFVHFVVCTVRSIYISFLLKEYPLLLHTCKLFDDQTQCSESQQKNWESYKKDLLC